MGGVYNTDSISGSVTFPIIFNDVFTALATAENFSDIVCVRELTNTGFNFYLHDRFGNEIAYNNLYWFAIGY